MNTNNNVYTIIYTTLIVVIVAALLAFVSQSLKERQDANEKAETISQMLTSAQYGTKAELDKLSNKDKLAKYADEIEKAFVIDTEGNVLRELEGIEVYGPKALKRQNYNIKGGANATGAAEIPVFKFKNGRTVVPIYGAGLWGPIWGYISFEADNATIAGAYFDHESETAGLGAKIVEPEFRSQFEGKHIRNAEGAVVSVAVLKAGKHAEGQEQVDAISGATITSSGVSTMLEVNLEEYAKFLATGEVVKEDQQAHKVLYVVNGKPVNNIDFLSPDEIIETKVFTNKEALDCYGIEGLEEVIVVITKEKEE